MLKRYMVCDCCHLMVEYENYEKRGWTQLKVDLAKEFSNGEPSNLRFLKTYQEDLDICPNCANAIAKNGLQYAMSYAGFRINDKESNNDR